MTLKNGIEFFVHSRESQTYFTRIIVFMIIPSLIYAYNTAIMSNMVAIS